MASNLVSHVGELLSNVDSDLVRGLEKVGLAAEANAKMNLTNFPRVDTGRLRNSVSHAVGGVDTVYIGTNVQYAPEVEFGTYKMAPSHFLKRSISEHTGDYKQMFENELKK